MGTNFYTAPKLDPIPVEHRHPVACTPALLCSAVPQLARAGGAAVQYKRDTFGPTYTAHSTPFGRPQAISHLSVITFEPSQEALGPMQTFEAYALQEDPERCCCWDGGPFPTPAVSLQDAVEPMFFWVLVQL